MLNIEICWKLSTGKFCNESQMGGCLLTRCLMDFFQRSLSFLITCSLFIFLLQELYFSIVEILFYRCILNKKTITDKAPKHYVSLD